jgi:hypothetical protein
VVEVGDRGVDEARVSATESVEQCKGVRIKLGDALEDLFVDMVHIGAILEGYVVVLAYLGGEPAERRHYRFAVIGLAVMLLNVYPKILDVYGVANPAQFGSYGRTVAHQVSEDVALDVFGQIVVKVA